jgi:hypothetical protein
MTNAEKINIALTIAGILLTVALTVGGWLVTRESLLKQFKLASNNIQRLSGLFWFRSLILWIISIIFEFLLYRWGILDLGVLVSLLVITTIWGLGQNFLSIPVMLELATTQTELKKVKTEIEILNQAKKIELENVKQRWSEFVDGLAEKPGYQVIGAFLKFSKPVHLEDDVLLVSIPEVVYNASSSFKLDGVTQLLKAFYGVEYKLKLSVIET